MKSLVASSVLFFVCWACCGQTQLAYLYSTSPGWVAGDIPQWYQNMEKYWYYRYRLVNDFMIIGDSAGQSLPASVRYRGDFANGSSGDALNNYFVPPSGDPTYDRQNLLDWGTDATVNLGHYLVVLATEYKLEESFGLPTTRTLDEIQHAQNAVARLCANSWWYEHSSDMETLGSYPGYDAAHSPSPITCSSCFGTNYNFFLRDDVPFLTFVDPNLSPEHYQHFNRAGLFNHLPDGITYPTDMYYVKKASGAFTGSYHGPDPRFPGTTTTTGSGGGPWDNPNCESQDQLVEIFVGEALLSKFLDGWEPSVISLRSEAQKAVFQLINWPSQPLLNYCVPSSLLNYYSIPDIVDPSCCAKMNCGSTGYIFFNAPAMTAASNVMTSSTYHFPSAINMALTDVPTPTNLVRIYGFELESLQNVTCSSSTWQDLTFTDGYVSFAHDWAVPAFIPGFSLALFATTPLTFLSSLGTSELIALGANYTSFSLGISHGTHSMNTIRMHALGNYFGSPQYPLMDEINFHADATHPWNGHWAIETLLDNAPKCGTWNNMSGSHSNPDMFSMGGGPDYYNHHNTYPPAFTLPAEFGADGPVSYWSGDDYLGQPDHRGGIFCYLNNGEATPGLDGEFSGCDYMELFDLYAADKNLNASSFSDLYLQDMINPYFWENFNINYPSTPAGASYPIGSYAHKLKLNWLEYYSAINTINEDGWLECRGAKKLDMLPGFQAKYGSFYHGYVKDFDCHGCEPGQDGAYNFAYINVTGPSYRHRLPDSSTDNIDSLAMKNGYDKDIPIAYFPQGTHKWTGKATPQTNNRQDEIADSLMNVPEIRESTLKFLKVAMINNARTDSDLLHLVMEKFQWNYDTIDKYKIDIPEEILVDIAPNPTTENAVLSYTLSKESQIKIGLANILGQGFNSLIEPYDDFQSAGQHKVQLNTVSLKPGVYLVSISINGKITTKKLVKT